MSKVDQDTMRIIIGCLLAHRNGYGTVDYERIKGSLERYLNLPQGQWEQIMKAQGWN